MSADAVVEIVAALVELAIEVGSEVSIDQAVEFTRKLRASNDTSATSKSTASNSKRPTRSIFDASVTYAVIGALMGGASLWFWPERIAHRPDARVSLVFITTMVGGGVMAAVGVYRTKRQRAPGRLATFSTGALFALAYAAARAIGHWLGS